MTYDGVIESEPFELRKERLKTYTGWYACSMFGTSYGRQGYKIEVEAWYYINGQLMRERKDVNGNFLPCHAYFNVDGATYKQAKYYFWQEWKEEHPNEYLWLGKFMGSSGL